MQAQWFYNYFIIATLDVEEERLSLRTRLKGKQTLAMLAWWQRDTSKGVARAPCRCGFLSKTRSFSDFSSRMSIYTCMFLELAEALIAAPEYPEKMLYIVWLCPGRQQASTAPSSEGWEILGNSRGKL